MNKDKNPSTKSILDTEGKQEMIAEITAAIESEK